VHRPTHALRRLPFKHNRHQQAAAELHLLHSRCLKTPPQQYELLSIASDHHRSLAWKPAPPCACLSHPMHCRPKLSHCRSLRDQAVLVHSPLVTSTSVRGAKHSTVSLNSLQATPPAEVANKNIQHARHAECQPLTRPSHCMPPTAITSRHAKPNLSADTGQGRLLTQLEPQGNHPMRRHVSKKNTVHCRCAWQLYQIST
jgi:hypothetical protein